MTDLVEAFESGAIDPATFHHREHLQMAWTYLGHLPFGEACLRFTTALRRFAAGAGKPEIYHETITWAYLVLIRDRMDRAGAGVQWQEFAARNEDLFAWKPSILDRIYGYDLLASERARRGFVLPGTE